MTSDFVPKRAHKKSRGGCKTCKTRKIKVRFLSHLKVKLANLFKCDEVQPTCTFCEKRSLTCEYISRASRFGTTSQPGPKSPMEGSNVNSPPSSDEVEELPYRPMEIVAPPSLAITTSAGTLNARDLRLIHHWSVFTSPNIAFGEPVHQTMQVAVPKLAFENDFLLNAIMGIASFHLQYLNPSSSDTESQKQTELYHLKALHLFRTTIPQICPPATPFSSQYEAALIMSIFLVVLCSQKSPIPSHTDLTVLNWLILYRGLAAVVGFVSWPTVELMSISPIFRRHFSDLIAPPSVPKILIQLLHKLTADDPDFAHLEQYCKVLDVLGILYASLAQDGLTNYLFVRIVSWPSYISQEFTDLAKVKSPRALIILGYYLCFIKLARRLWWIDGLGDRDLDALFTILGPEWGEYLAVPMQVRILDDEEEIVKLMLR